METQKSVNLALVVMTTLVFVFLSKLAFLVWGWLNLPVFEDWTVQLPYLVSFVLAVVLGASVRRSQVANTFFNEVVEELTRVSWPQRKETVSSAVVVVILLAISAGSLLIIDTLWRAVIRGLLSL